MSHKILMVYENEEICPEAVEYAKGLARRLDAEVTLLMIVEMAFLDRTRLGGKRNAISELDKKAGRLLSELSAGFVRQGAATSVALRVGDPAQEFVKFLAERPPFTAVIWGSSQELPPGRRHWMAKAAAALECPLWTVSSRRSEP